MSIHTANPSVVPCKSSFEDSRGRTWSFDYQLGKWYRETGKDRTILQGDVEVDVPCYDAVDLDWFEQDEDRVTFLVEELAGAYAKIAQLQATISGFQKVRGQ